MCNKEFMKPIVTALMLSASLQLFPAFGAPRQATKPVAKPGKGKSTPAKVTPPKPTPPRGMMVAPFVMPLRETSRNPLRGPVYLPKGSSNLALNRPVSAKSLTLMGAGLSMITDGIKASFHGNGVVLGEGTQWVQIDLQNPVLIHGILIWHNFFEPRTYHDVVVQISNDPHFESDVRTVFNNDEDNSSKLGIGKDREYVEDFQGHWIPIKTQKAQYVRLYSRGSSYVEKDGSYTSYSYNEYAEVEVWATNVPGLEPAPFELPTRTYTGWKLPQEARQ